MSCSALQWIWWLHPRYGCIHKGILIGVLHCVAACCSECSGYIRGWVCMSGILEGVLQRVAACCSEIGGTKLLNRQEVFECPVGAHYNTIHSDAIHCNLFPQSTIHSNVPLSVEYSRALDYPHSQLTATHCNSLQHAAMNQMCN